MEECAGEPECAVPRSGVERSRTRWMVWALAHRATRRGGRKLDLLFLDDREGEADRASPQA
jgi:hypothetical protein